ncbi:MAG: LytR/AlgR family response regulator transcription factor [Flammeovirgaceae bacterium]
MEQVHILVVEDEIVVAEDIAMRLEDMNYKVVGMAASGTEALALLQEENRIDLCLLDIILQGAMDGIELARTINEHHQVPVIFLTSQADKYFVERAKSVNPYAYMLKPFNDHQIKISIELALANYAQNTPVQDISEGHHFSKKDNEALRIKDSLFLKKDHFFERVLFKNILWIEAESNYTVIHTNNGKFMYATLLHKIEERLPSNQFLRVHRSYVINMHVVTGYIKNMLYIKDKTFPVSKRYAKAVFAWFNTL